mmetsp:Transcript_47693/g.103739  ORF Transcript_47693/g.103739 Transcript_47693/m.103739 type:complete len:172 (-) Transcript_47693:53-568(-)
MPAMARNGAAAKSRPSTTQVVAIAAPVAATIAGVTSSVSPGNVSTGSSRLLFVRLLEVVATAAPAAAAAAAAAAAVALWCTPEVDAIEFTSSMSWSSSSASFKPEALEVVAEPGNLPPSGQRGRRPIVALAGTIGQAFHAAKVSSALPRAQSSTKQHLTQRPWPRSPKVPG